MYLIRSWVVITKRKCPKFFDTKMSKVYLVILGVNLLTLSTVAPMYIALRKSVYFRVIVFFLGRSVSTFRFGYSFVDGFSI